MKKNFKKAVMLILVCFLIAFIGIKVYNTWNDNTYGKYTERRTYIITAQNDEVTTLTSAYHLRLSHVDPKVNLTQHQVEVNTKELYPSEIEKGEVTLHYWPQTANWTWDVKIPWYINIARIISVLTLPLGIIILAITAIEGFESYREGY